MGVGFKVGGSGVFKSFIVVTANIGESITLRNADDSTITETITATLGTATFTVKKKGTYNLTSSDGATASVEVLKTGTAYEVVVKWESVIRATANSNTLVTAKQGSYTVSGTTGSATPTDTVDLTVLKKGTYTVTSADGAFTTVNVSANGETYTADTIVLAYISVTGNAGFNVTATLGSYSVSGTLDSTGKATLAVRQLGTYTVTSADGSSGSINVATDGGTYSITVKWTSTVTVRANPSAVITLTKNDNANIKYSATANSSTGVASITVLCKGTYNISSNNGGAYGAEGNNSSVAVTGSTASAQFVKLNIPGSLAVGNYSSNVLTAYWTRPSTNWTGCNVRYNSGTTAPANRSSGTNLATGAGNSIALTTTNVNGYNTGALSANTNYAFAIFSYITINGTTYWCTTSRTATGKTASYVGVKGTLSGSGKFTVPTGWRQMQVYLVGGGGGGGTTNSRGGGGGGYVTLATINVTPGTQYSYTVGSGGAGATSQNTAGSGGGTTTFGSYSAAGGGGGRWQYDGGNYWSGGNGGSGGGARSMSTQGSSLQSSGGAGGSNGASGGSNQYDTSNHKYLGGTGQGNTTFDGTVYAGGGGGGGHTSSHTGGSGGTGGGGRGSSASGSAGSAGTDGTGGGGGGGWGGSTYTNGGRGGNGTIVYKCTA